MLRIIAEYYEPMTRFRRERIQDTVVFFGSARFRALDVASHELELLENTGSITPAPADEQPARAHEVARGEASEQRLRLAEAAVEMSRYYEDARTLAGLVSRWAMTLPGRRRRYVITSGGGPGIMEAANRGAYEAGAKTIGLNIKLPFEQMPNPYITPDLNFEFHYFFMRKFWFAYLAKALVVFPGGFGTMDEMFELLTLAQTQKLAKKITVVIYGPSYWKSVINLDVFAQKGAIARKDLDLFQFADTPEQAFDLLKAGLTDDMEHEAAFDREHALPSIGVPDASRAQRPGTPRPGHRQNAVVFFILLFRRIMTGWAPAPLNSRTRIPVPNLVRLLAQFLVQSSSLHLPSEDWRCRKLSESRRHHHDPERLLPMARAASRRGIHRRRCRCTAIPTSRSETLDFIAELSTDWGVLQPLCAGRSGAACAPPASGRTTRAATGLRR